MLQPGWPNGGEEEVVSWQSWFVLFCWWFFFTIEQLVQIEKTQTPGYTFFLSGNTMGPTCFKIFLFVLIYFRVYKVYLVRKESG